MKIFSKEFFKKFYLDILLFVFALIVSILFIKNIPLLIIVILILWIIGVFKCFKEIKNYNLYKKFKDEKKTHYLSSGDFDLNPVDNYFDDEINEILNQPNIQSKIDLNEFNNLDDRFDELENTLVKNYKSNIIKTDYISKVLMLNEYGAPIKEWNISGMVSVIIGKDNNIDDVDIDLSSSVYSALISSQHAVLNYSNKGWFIEDYYSDNGILIEKSYNKGKLDKIDSGEPYKIDFGDIIYIANTKLLIV
ncbi:MAG: FHA domain-containing protein [Oscillospiraceae bacterium]|nr:FHA domain-containing protein [Oscillospiraceae bacterium]